MNADRDKPRIITHDLRWHIHWTGWKENHNLKDGALVDDTLVSQWLAWDRRDKRYFYASVPGGAGEYKKGDVFDIRPGVNQVLITRDTLLGTALDMYEEGYQRLLKVLEDIGVDTHAVYKERLMVQK